MVIYCRIQRMMADELAVGKSGQTEVFKSPENSTVRTECDAVNEETQLVKPNETKDLANYSQLKLSTEGQALPKKLCGYLNKLGGKGPLKGCKTRWFVYDQKKCHLYYFRTAQDSSPLGSMDLSNAAFNYCLEAEEGTFEIKTPEKDYTLKAKNREVMMYWLQQLQQKRWEHGDEQNHLLLDGLTISTQQPESPPACKSEENEFLDPVKTPTGLVGEEAASLPAPLQPTTLHNISLKHLGTEIQNFGSKTVFQFYGNKPLRENRTSFEDIKQGNNEAGEESSLAKGGDVSVKDSPPEELKTEFRKHSAGSFRTLTNLLNSSPLSPEKCAVKDGSSPDKATRLHNEVLRLTNELNAQRELVKLLHKALEAAQLEKRACNSYLAADDESTRLELVRHKVRQIMELDNRVSALEKENQELKQSLRLQRDHIEELKQHIQLLMEKNHAKQEVVLKLSEQMATESTFATEPCDKAAADTLSKLKEKIAHLKDDQEAYKTQNKFLNSEIYQITKLWQSTSEHEKKLAMKCTYLEARYCQIESKYLVMLRKLQDNITDQDETHQEMVKQLIDDLLKWEIKDESGLEVGRLYSEHDEYGFKLVPSPMQDKKNSARIHALERKSNNLMANQEGQEKAIQVKWANYLAGRTCGELVPSPELKILIRNGIPKEHRCHVWKWCTNRRVQHIRERYGSNRYQELLKLCKNKQQAASKQIELDLLRTLTNNRLFASPTSKLVQKLRRVLLAYSWQNPDIGYCQGLNRLAAVALLILREEDAFWCLVAIIDCIMPEDYYSKTLTGSQVDQRVFKDLLSEKLPRLTSHFDQYNVDLSYITFNWFLVVFVDSLLTDILLRVWDAFLYEGTKVIFRYALAIFKYNEEEILKLHDNLAIYEYLRCLTKNISEGRKLMNIAFVEMNPFPMRLLRNRRAAHLEKLNAELSELERIREAYVKERVEQKDSIGGSEDEEET
ncbi:TBC1 domain family member 2A [Heptranchias perlo]|uniref:TBC1 domain family member 2A n=1 Tax=Heptranchias perlo TaxID=212740 RepID=UPI003559D603